MKQSVAFNSADCPSFMKVTGVEFPVFFNVNMYDEAVPHRIGNYDAGIEIGSDQYKVDFIIAPESVTDNVFTMGDKLRKWLEGDNLKPSALTFMEQPDRYVLARVSSAVNIKDLIVAGEGSVTFTASNPLKYSYADYTITSAASKATVSFTGTATYSPLIEITVPTACDGITLTTNKSSKQIILSTKFNASAKITIDCQKKLIKLNNQVNMKILDLKSEWFELETGSNVITATTKTAGVVPAFTVKYKSCWR